MENTNEFRGVCPLCYVPVRAEEDSRMLRIGERNETYHTYCLHEYVQQNATNGRGDKSLGFALLEQYRGVLLPSPEKREGWIEQNKYNWVATGQILKERREEIGITLKEMAMAMGISVARLKRFEAGDPVRDARLLHQSYIAMIYIKYLEYRLSITTDQLERNQDELQKAIIQYENLTPELDRLSAAVSERFAQNEG